MSQELFTKTKTILCEEKEVLQIHWVGKIAKQVGVITYFTDPIVVRWWCCWGVDGVVRGSTFGCSVSGACEHFQCYSPLSFLALSVRLVTCL